MDYLRTKGKNRFKVPEYFADSIQKAVRSSFLLLKQTSRKFNLYDERQFYYVDSHILKQIKELDKYIELIKKSMQVHIGENINQVALREMIGL